MSTVVEFFQEGGPFMLLTMFAFLASVILSGVQLALVRRVDLVGVLIAAVIVTLALGTVGTVLSLFPPFVHTAVVDPVAKEAARALSLAEASNNVILAIGLAAVQTVLVTLAATWRANLGPK